MSLSSLRTLSCLALLCGGLASAQTSAASPPTATLAPQTTLPITFTKALSAKDVKAGDAIQARTAQQVRLANGQIVAQGAQVLGHMVAAQPFVFDKTPYASQRQAILSLQFDTLVTRQGNIPLHVSVRAIADSFASMAAMTPGPSDLDPDYTTTQVGGDLVSRYQNAIVSPEGDTVGYNKRDGNFAHLIANGRCDGSNTEQPVSIFSASACGAYGFTGMALTLADSNLSITSSRRTPEIPSHSYALLEVTPEGNVASAAH